MEDQRLDNQIEISGAIHGGVEKDVHVDLFSVYEQLTSLDLEELKNLCRRVSTASPISIVPEKLTILEFEMLEAELRNQGILQKSPETISQTISREINQLTWSVRHHVKNDQQLVVFLNVPKYVFKKTLSNLELLSINDTQFDETIIQELRYLNQLATYLNGAYENVETAYERGLNLVLRSIRSGSHNLDGNSAQKIEIIFPIDRKALMKEILKIEK